MIVKATRKNGLLASLPLQSWELLAPEIKEVAISSGAIIQEAGQPVERVYFPHGGLISLQVVTQDGGSIETGLVGGEGAIGFQRGTGRLNAFTRAVAHIGGNFASISGEKFEHACAENPALREVLFRYSEYTSTQAQQIAACHACHRTEARLARWLLQCSDLIGGETIPATQDLLAQAFCVRRTTVTLIAHEMQAADIIKYRRGVIQLVDRKRLQEVACECYGVIQEALRVFLGAENRRFPDDRLFEAGTGNGRPLFT